MASLVVIFKLAKLEPLSAVPNIMNGSVSNDTTTLTIRISLTVELTMPTQESVVSDHFHIITSGFEKVGTPPKILTSTTTYGVVPNVPYKTVALPSNYAYSVRLAPPSSELSSPLFGTSVKGKDKSKNSGYGFAVALYDPDIDKVYLDKECGADGYACYAVDTVATGSSAKICVVIINPTKNNAILNVVVSFSAESIFISNDLNSNSNLFNFAVTDIPANETIPINYKEYVATAQLSKRYYKG
nr:8373_t:CDS:2 [Entrophospora candida]